MDHLVWSYTLDAEQTASLQDVTDRALFKLIREGDSAAFEELFTRYETRLVGYAARYLDSVDLAKDVCQEVFLKLIRKPPRVLMSDSLAPWLFRVTRNLAIDRRRSRKFEVHHPEAEKRAAETRTADDPFQSLSAKSDLELLHKLVDQLPPDIRDVVNLRINGGVSFKEISVILNVPQGTALWRMHRALELLRREWRRHGH